MPPYFRRLSERHLFSQWRNMSPKCNIMPLLCNFNLVLDDNGVRHRRISSMWFWLYRHFFSGIMGFTDNIKKIQLEPYPSRNLGIIRTLPLKVSDTCRAYFFHLKNISELRGFIYLKLILRNWLKKFISTTTAVLFAGIQHMQKNLNILLQYLNHSTGSQCNAESTQKLF